MTEETPVGREEVYDFIREEIDAIPHLEALLLIWKSRPKQWTVEEIAKELYVSSGMAHNVLQGLNRRGLLVLRNGIIEQYTYESLSIRRDSLLEALDATYRRELIPISRLIHSKGTAAMQDFAQAFRFTKDRECMGPAVYILCAVTTGLCATLLLRGYWRMKQRLLLWSGFLFLRPDGVQSACVRRSGNAAGCGPLHVPAVPRDCHVDHGVRPDMGRGVSE